MKRRSGIPADSAPTEIRVGMISLGCAKNLVDGEVMLGHLQRAGVRITADGSAADVVVVNTCGFIDDAKRESIDAILEVAEGKRKGRVRRLVVAGCMAQAYAREPAAEISRRSTCSSAWTSSSGWWRPRAASWPATSP